MSSAHLSIGTAPSLLFAILLNPSFSSTDVRNSLSEFCAQHSFKFSANRWLEISWFSYMVRVSRRSTVAFGKQMLRESSRSVNRAALQRRIQAMEIRCYRKILRISYKDNVTNEEVRAKPSRLSNHTKSSRPS